MVFTWLSSCATALMLLPSVFAFTCDEFIAAEVGTEFSTQENVSIKKGKTSSARQEVHVKYLDVEGREYALNMLNELLVYGGKYSLKVEAGFGLMDSFDGAVVFRDYKSRDKSGYGFVNRLEGREEQKGVTFNVNYYFHDHEPYEVWYMSLDTETLTQKMAQCLVDNKLVAEYKKTIFGKVIPDSIKFNSNCNYYRINQKHIDILEKHGFKQRKIITYFCTCNWDILN